MNPELNYSSSTSIPLPDIITSHQLSTTNLSVQKNDLYAPGKTQESTYLAQNDDEVSRKKNISILCNSVIRELLTTTDTDRINKIASLFDDGNWRNITPENDNSEIQNMIDNLRVIQNYIIKGGGDDDYKNGLLYARGEQLNRLHGLIRNQSLYQKYAMVRLDPIITSYQIKSADGINHSLRQSDVAPETRSEDQITTSTSYSEIWYRLAMAIGEIKSDYVDFYADLMQSYTEMYESFNKFVQKASADAVKTGTDGNNVAFDTNIMHEGYSLFDKEVARLNNELGSVKGWSNMTDDAKQSMITTLEPAFEVDSSNGNITFNMNQYNSIVYTYPAGINDGKVSTASYQAWLASFNAAGNAFQSNMQSFAQRYSQANNTFDNINKVLSGAISALGDSARDVLKSLT